MEGNVFVNARALHRPTSGVERYTVEVLARLGDRVRTINGAWAPQGLGGHFWEQFLLPLRTGRGGLLWSPANSGPLAVANQVVTIHDLSVFDQPGGFDPSFRLWYRLLLPRLARRVKRVITDSDFSRKRIVHRLGIPPERVVRIPCGIDRRWFYPRSEAEISRLRRRYGLPESYVLFLGSHDPRKNLVGVLQAWEQIGDKSPRLGLAVAGGSPRSFRRPNSNELPHGATSLGYVDERDLPALYSGALALIMPSLYEGFGLPALEAMACETPVIFSRIPALQEVVGEAGIYVDPLDIKALSKAISQLISNPALRRDLICKGREQVKSFSWERTASQVWELLEALR